MKLFSIILFAMFALAFVACQSVVPPASPTEVFKAQTEAQKKKDGATMKSNLSKISLEMIDKGAKAQNKSVEEVLVMELPGVKAPQTFEYRNEKIEGDSASVEVKTELSDEWAKVPFVKEDGRWKLSLDKMIEEAQKAAQQSESTGQTNSAAPSNQQTNSAPTNQQTNSNK